METLSISYGLFIVHFGDDGLVLDSSSVQEIVFSAENIVVGIVTSL